MTKKEICHQCKEEIIGNARYRLEELTSLGYKETLYHDIDCLFRYFHIKATKKFRKISNEKVTFKDKLKEIIILIVLFGLAIFSVDIMFGW